MSRQIQTISAKRQKLIDELNASEFKEGEFVNVAYNAVNTYKNEAKADKTVLCKILSVLKDKIQVEVRESKDKYLITPHDIKERDLYKIGANPFNEKFFNTRSVAYILETILYTFNILGEGKNNEYDIKGVPIGELNWNPFVYNKKGEKEYYQRPFVWSLEDKQNLIESIYQQIDCGKILIRKRGFEELKKMQAKGETELFFHEIIDSKQRLDAIRGFIMGEYTDKEGNYYGDLSRHSQRLLTDHQLFSYSEMPENTPDEEVIQQFLRLNFSGIPQSKEHIEFVKSIQNKI